MTGIVDKMIYVPKTWGNELWVVNNDKYCGKVLSVNEGGFCSYHYHLIKDEVLMVTEGRVLFIYSKTPILPNQELITSCPGHEQVLLEAGQAWRVTPGIIHQFYGVTSSKITEFSTQHFDEDSYRVTKKFIGDLNAIS